MYDGRWYNVILLHVDIKLSQPCLLKDCFSLIKLSWRHCQKLGDQKCEGSFLDSAPTICLSVRTLVHTAQYCCPACCSLW